MIPFMNTTSSDHLYTETRDALAGGTPMAINFVFPAKGEESLIEAHK
uniref:Uncharacterized protein n=1 Tax=Lepeophtheirus salmonis TaxID=72036 RepID=A0A0K2UIZ8_LEPSM